MESKSILGRRGEEFVAQHLQRENFKILHKNLRTPFGEVDLVASKDDVFYLFEVKTRRGSLVRGTLGWGQRVRLSRAALNLWQQYRKEYRTFRCVLLVVTSRGIKWTSLPLLYDRA